MSNYKLVDADKLDADLESVADSIRSKGGTSEKLSFPDGMKTAIDAISTGVTVQRKTGSFTTDASGNATVNCGFKPDLVVLTDLSFTLYGGQTCETQMVAAFSEQKTSKSLFPATFDHYSWLLNGVFLRTTTGFSVTSLVSLATDFSQKKVSGRTFNYVAIKYTE